MIIVLLNPARNSARLLTAPSSLSSPRQHQCRQPVQHRSHKGTVTGGQQAADHQVHVVVVPPAAQGKGGGGKGTEHSALLLPGSHSRSVRTSARSFPCCHHCHWGLSGGGERPRRWLPGAEAVTEKAAAAVIMTCFIVGCGCMLSFWFGGCVNYHTLDVNDVV